MRAFFCPAMSGLVDLTSALAQIMLRASQKVGNEYLSIFPLNNAINTLIIKLLSSIMLFEKFKAAGSFF